MLIKHKKYSYYKFTKEYIRKITKEYEEKFKRLLNYVEANKKFPDFENDPKLNEKYPTLRSQYKDFPITKYIFESNFFYERNATLISKFHRQNKIHEKEILYQSLLKNLNYQKEYLVLPIKALHFNKYSSLVFSYLEQGSKI